MNLLSTLLPTAQIGVHRAMGLPATILGVEGGHGGSDDGPGAWMFELRGILTVIIGVVVLMGSVYFILSTNMGSRLAFLVSFASLAGWMALMGAIWWTYGIGLRGAEPSWDPVPGAAVLQNPGALRQAGVIDEPLQVPADADPELTSQALQQRLSDEGWLVLDPSEASFGQASSAAEEYLLESGAFASNTEYRVINVYDIGGERYPRFADGAVDFIAFFHRPRHSLVEVAPVVPVRVEPGRAPVPPVIDETQPRQFVYMERNRGSRRHPAALITVGSTIVFGASCWLLHRRDKRVALNRSQLALPAQA